MMQNAVRIKRYGQDKLKYRQYYIHYMGLFGNILGRALGSIGSALLPIKGIDGGEVGGALGSLAPFKTGGRVPRTGRALIHKGEYILPAGIAPTKSQKDRVAKGKAKAKAKKGKKGKK
jgi:hypothetical protein